MYNDLSSFPRIYSSPRVKTISTPMPASEIKPVIQMKEVVAQAFTFQENISPESKLIGLDVVLLEPIQEVKIEIPNEVFSVEISLYRDSNPSLNVSHITQKPGNLLKNERSEINVQRPRKTITRERSISAGVETRKSSYHHHQQTTEIQKVKDLSSSAGSGENYILPISSQISSRISPSKFSSSFTSLSRSSGSSVQIFDGDSLPYQLPAIFQHIHNEIVTPILHKFDERLTIIKDTSDKVFVAHKRRLLAEMPKPSIKKMCMDMRAFCQDVVRNEFVDPNFFFNDYQEIESRLISGLKYMAGGVLLKDVFDRMRILNEGIENERTPLMYKLGMALVKLTVPDFFPIDCGVYSGKNISNFLEALEAVISSESHQKSISVDHLYQFESDFLHPNRKVEVEEKSKRKTEKKKHHRESNSAIVRELILLTIGDSEVEVKEIIQELQRWNMDASRIKVDCNRIAQVCNKAKRYFTDTSPGNFIGYYCFVENSFLKKSEGASSKLTKNYPELTMPDLVSLTEKMMGLLYPKFFIQSKGLENPTLNREGYILRNPQLIESDLKCESLTFQDLAIYEMDVYFYGDSTTKVATLTFEWSIEQGEFKQDAQSTIGKSGYHCVLSFKKCQIISNATEHFENLWGSSLIPLTLVKRPIL